MVLDGQAAASAVVSFLVAAVPILLFVLTACLLMRSIAGRYTAKLLIVLITTGFGNGAMGLAYFSLADRPHILGDGSGFLAQIVRDLDPTLIGDALFGSYLALAAALVIMYAKRIFGRHYRDADDDMLRRWGDVTE